MDFTEFVLSQLPEPPRRVLEVGCGYEGGIAPALAAAGHQVLAIDPNAPAGPLYRRATIEKFEGPILRPIEITTNGQRGHVRIDGAVEVETTPIRNALAGGQEIEVRMVYPKGGILWNDGNMVTTSTMRASHDSLRLEWPGKFAVIAEVSWTNAA